MTLKIVDDEGKVTDQAGHTPRIGWWIDPQSGKYAHGTGGRGAGEGLVADEDVPEAVRRALTTSETAPAGRDYVALNGRKLADALDEEFPRDKWDRLGSEESHEGHEHGAEDNDQCAAPDVIVTLERAFDGVRRWRWDGCEGQFERLDANC